MGRRLIRIELFGSDTNSGMIRKIRVIPKNLVSFGLTGLIRIHWITSSD